MHRFFSFLLSLLQTVGQALFALFRFLLLICGAVIALVAAAMVLRFMPAREQPVADEDE